MRATSATAARVSLMRWLRRQLAQPLSEREHLEAAVASDDPEEVRRLLDRAAFTAEQRRHVEGLLAAWERETSSES